MNVSDMNKAPQAEAHDAAGVLLKAAERVESGKCNGTWARTADGRAVFPWSHGAASWCALGAVWSVEADCIGAHDTALRRLEDVLGGCDDIGAWSDANDAATVAGAMRQAARTILQKV